jgi:hypothetical protein
MKVDLIEPTSKAPSALGEIYSAIEMMFRGALIQLRLCTIVVTCVKIWVVKLPFPNEVGSKMKKMANNVMWHEKDISFKIVHLLQFLVNEHVQD